MPGDALADGRRRSSPSTTPGDDPRGCLLASCRPSSCPSTTRSGSPSRRPDRFRAESRFANSAMDGYAVRAATSLRLPVVLRVSGQCRQAGSSCSVGPGEAIKIMTGAPIPVGADVVVLVERTTLLRETGLDPGVPPAGEHVRPPARTSRRARSSSRAVGHRSGVIAILAALGHPTAEVSLRPRVAIISTGDELSPRRDRRPGRSATRTRIRFAP